MLVDIKRNCDEIEKDALCTHNPIYNSILRSIQDNFRALNTILPQIHCILFKSVHFRGFSVFSRLLSAQLWGSHPARFGDRVRVSYLLLAVFLFCWNRMYPFYNILSPFKWLQQIPGSKYRILSKLTQIMGVASSPLWGPSSCILSTTIMVNVVLESDVPILQYYQF